MHRNNNIKATCTNCCTLFLQYRQNYKVFYLYRHFIKQIYNFSRFPLYFKEGRVIAAILDFSDENAVSYFYIDNVIAWMHKHFSATIALINLTRAWEQSWNNSNTVAQTNDIAVVTLSKPISKYYLVQETLPSDRLERQFYQNAIIKAAKLPTETEVLGNNLFLAGYGEGKVISDIKNKN